MGCTYLWVFNFCITVCIRERERERVCVYVCEFVVSFQCKFISAPDNLSSFTSLYLSQSLGCVGSIFHFASEKCFSRKRQFSFYLYIVKVGG